MTQDYDEGHGSLIGIWKGQGNNSDRLYIHDLYTTWLIVRPDPQLLMPGEEAEWQVVFAGDQMPAGEYMSSLYFTVNGYGDGGEINARMHSRQGSVRYEPSLIPTTIMLSPAYPNPFNSNTNISYEITQPSFLRLAVYDIQGHLINELENRRMIKGNHSMT